jgi:hypothetical protein
VGKQWQCMHMAANIGGGTGQHNTGYYSENCLNQLYMNRGRWDDCCNTRVNRLERMQTCMLVLQPRCLNTGTNLARSLVTILTELSRLHLTVTLVK